MKIKFIVCLLFILHFGILSFGQSKNGYIDCDTVIKFLPEYTNGLKQIEVKSKQLQDKFDLLSKNNLQLINDFIPHRSKFDSAMFYDFERKRDSLEMEIRNFQAEAERLIRKEENDLDLVVKNKMRAEMKAFCARAHLEYLFDKNALFYCANCMDYTNQFIEFLKRNK